MQPTSRIRMAVLFCLSAWTIAVEAGAASPPAQVIHGEPLPSPEAQTETRSEQAVHLGGRVLVKTRAFHGPSYIVASTSQWRTQITGQLPRLNVARLQVPPGEEEAVIQHLRRDPLVDYAELDYGVHIQQVPNDPKWADQWGPNQIDAPQAWDITHSLDIVIAVLDTGIAVGHPDLRNQLWTNPGEIPNNGLDDDGNGKVDDIYGWHFYQNCTGTTCTPYENHVIQDDNGHGTHVAGIAAAETNNGIGIAGVSWGAQLMTVRVLDRYGDGYYSDVAAGIVYAADNGARVINLSFGGEQPSQLLQDAVDYAHQRGVLVVAAAGNDGGGVLYPAACNHAMAVAATDRNDRHASFSNQGPEVDIAAPGESILSTWHMLNGYFTKGGTSMATPHVSGAAALLWSWWPGYTHDQIRHRLETMADDVNSEQYPGHDAQLGWGRLNAHRALTGLPSGPTLTPTASPTATPTFTPSPTPTATPKRYSYHLLLIFKEHRAPP